MKKRVAKSNRTKPKPQFSAISKRSTPTLEEIVRKYDDEVHTSYDDIGATVEALRWMAWIMLSYDRNPCLIDKDKMRGFGCVLEILSNQLALMNSALDNARDFSLQRHKSFD